MERFVIIKIRDDLFIIWDKKDKKAIDCTDNSTMANNIVNKLEN